MKARILALALLGGVLFTACRPEDDEAATPQTENEHIRMVASSTESASFTYMNVKEEKAETFNVMEKNPYLYTVTGRFAYLIHREKDRVEIFDSGIETHGDHIHIKGTPKMAALQLTEGKPTHFFGQGEKAIIFNDGTGSVTIVDEEKIHDAGYQPTIVRAAVAHHGAAVLFLNGTLAVTDRLPDYAGSNPALPTTVRLVDLQGKEVASTNVKVAGMHGEAFNGKYAAFGSTDGVVLVESSGKSAVVPNHPDLEANKLWLGSLAGHETLEHFYGYSSRKGGGIYKVDPVKKEMTPLLKTDVLGAVKLSRDGKTLVVLLKNGTMQIYDARTGSKSAERSGVIPDYSNTATGEGVVTPSFDISSFGIYVSDPLNQKVTLVSSRNLAEVKSMPMPKVGRVVLLGML
ncbi:MAG: hypothetical protein MUD08_11425 [Cytophagales bacterium]|jgi:hypothetical protein|nr:hypothetical protein [Cytophagales bacterium]